MTRDMSPDEHDPCGHLGCTSCNPSCWQCTRTEVYAGKLTPCKVCEELVCDECGWHACPACREWKQRDPVAWVKASQAHGGGRLLYQGTAGSPWNELCPPPNMAQQHVLDVMAETLSKGGTVRVFQPKGRYHPFLPWFHESDSALDNARGKGDALLWREALRASRRTANAGTWRVCRIPWRYRFVDWVKRMVRRGHR